MASYMSQWRSRRAEMTRLRFDFSTLHAEMGKNGPESRLGKERQTPGLPLHPSKERSMRTQPPPQISASEPSGKPAQSPGDGPPSGPDAPAAKPAREGALFHLLIERGWDAELAERPVDRVT